MCPVIKPAPSSIKRFNRGALLASFIQLHFEEAAPWLLEVSQKSRFRPQEEMASQVQIGKWHSNILGTRD